MILTNNLTVPCNLSPCLVGNCQNKTKYNLTETAAGSAFALTAQTICTRRSHNHISKLVLCVMLPISHYIEYK